MTTKPYSRSALIARIRKGGFANEIADEAGLSPSWVRKVAKDAGLVLPLSSGGRPASGIPSWVDDHLHAGWARVNRSKGEFAAAAWARAMKRNVKEAAE